MLSSVRLYDSDTNQTNGCSAWAQPPGACVVFSKLLVRTLCQNRHIDVTAKNENKRKNPLRVIRNGGIERTESYLVLRIFFTPNTNVSYIQLLEQAMLRIFSSSVLQPGKFSSLGSLLRLLL